MTTRNFQKPSGDGGDGEPSNNDEDDSNDSNDPSDDDDIYSDLAEDWLQLFIKNGCSTNFIEVKGSWLFKA